MLVLAGAGSGKTRVITHRIARLVERGVPAKAIVALTFTNKAAGEMRERVASLTKMPGGGNGDKRTSATARAVTVATFHSFGLSVLTKERKALGGVFTIFDQGDALGTVKEILRSLRAQKNYDADAVLTRISNAKNAFLSPEELRDGENDEYDEITKIVYPRYQAALKQFRAYDFDDLVCEVARIWKARKDVLERWQEQFRYVLVDEYQDTNRAQLELLRLLAAQHQNICVVGDDDQSIYAWRGADVRNILEFEQHFAGATVIKLEQNYRSRTPILAVANAVIGKRADSKYRKVLFTERAGGEKVKVAVAASPEIEARFVAKEIRRQVREEGRHADGTSGAPPRRGLHLSNIAVLYRSNGQSKAIEEALREQGVPHRVIGGQQFFERKEVKDLLAYMKLVVNAYDEISLRRILNYPARGIGDTSIERLVTHALARGWTLWQAVERVDALDDIPAAAREGCKQLEAVIVESQRQIEAKVSSGDLVRSLAERIGLKREVEVSSGSAPVAKRRWSNVESLFQSFTRRDARVEAGAERGLAAFLQALTLDFSEKEEDATDVVTLSTLHGSKGLEFDVVFLIGCEEGLLPHSRTLDARATDSAPADIEEERRLFYVGVTRAKELLYLSRAKARVMRGKPVPRTPSRFLVDIPPELVEEREVKDDPAMSALDTVASANALLAALNSLG